MEQTRTPQVSRVRKLIESQKHYEKLDEQGTSRKRTVTPIDNRALSVVFVFIALQLQCKMRAHWVIQHGTLIA